MAKAKEQAAIVPETDDQKMVPAKVPQENLPAVPDMEADAGAGFEGMGTDDLAIPFIVILQSGSPQLKRGESKIEGANEGDIFNTITGAVWDGCEGIFVIPCAYRKAWVEWTPREQGGGFVRQYDEPSILDQTTKDTTGKDVLSNGHIIVPTAYHYILVVDPITGDYGEGVISFTSTQLKKSRKWNSLMSNLKLTRKDGTKYTPAMFSHLYQLTTEPEANDLGAWSGWKINLHSQVPTMDLYRAGKKLALNVSGGLVKLTPPSSTEAQSDNVPF